MTLDEAIAKYKEITNTDANCPIHCMRSCDKCVQESGQCVEWLEELKAIKSDGFTDDLLNMGFTKGYNKAIDDFSERIKQVTYTSGTESDGYYKIHAICERDIDEIAEQLKGGDGE